MAGVRKSMSTALVVLVMTGSGISQNQNDAGRVLDTVGETYKTFKSYHFEGTIVREVKSQGLETKMETPIVVAAMKPDKMRMEIRSAAMNIDILAISNGRTIWEYMPRQKEYTKKDVAEIGGDKDLYFQMWAAALGVALPQYEQIAAHRVEPKILREEPLDLEGRSIDCYVIQADYDLPVSSNDSERWSKTFWIDKGRYIVIKEVSITKDARFEKKYTITFSIAKVEESLPDTLFLFTPPEGTKEVKKLSSREKKRTK